MNHMKKTVFEHAWILTMDEGFTQIRDGWLLVEGRNIAAMGEGDYAGEKFNNTRQVIRFQHIKDNGDYTRYGGWTLDYGEDEIVTSFGNYSFVTEPSKIEYLSDYMCFAF